MHAIVVAFVICVLLALAVATGSFTGMIVRWKTKKRRGHVIRLLVAVAMIPCLTGVYQAYAWLVFMPALARDQMKRVNAARAEKFAKTSEVMVGDPAPPFSIKTVDGEEFFLPQHGKVVLINFFATWCGPCRIELPHIEKIWLANRDNQRFRLLVIGREETLDSVRDYRAMNGFTFPMAPDPDRAVFSLFAKESIPRTLVISPEGTIVYARSGFYEEDILGLTAALGEQLAHVMDADSMVPHRRRGLNRIQLLNDSETNEHHVGYYGIDQDMEVVRPINVESTPFIMATVPKSSAVGWQDRLWDGSYPWDVRDFSSCAAEKRLVAVEAYYVR